MLLKELYKLVRSQPNQGRNFYRLGVIHINENNLDSANYYFKQGLRAIKDADVNNIGLGKLVYYSKKIKKQNLNLMPEPIM